MHKIRIPASAEARCGQNETTITEISNMIA